MACVSTIFSFFQIFVGKDLFLETLLRHTSCLSFLILSFVWALDAVSSEITWTSNRFPITMVFREIILCFQLWLLYG